MIQLTLLLRKALGGDKAAEQEAIALVYPELKRIAARMAALESSDPSLSPTILVSDFYTEKFRSPAGLPGNITDRNHFFSIAARAMRQVLVDRARSRNAQKRQPVDPNFFQRACTAISPETLLALEAALKRLELIAPQAARVIELRYFLGSTVEETAKSLGISTKQVRAEWDFARQWLESELS